MISSKRAQQIETLWMSDRQGLVSLTMANKPEESISRIKREDETATYSVGTTLRTLPMQKKTKTETKDKKIQNTCNTERKRKKRIKINRLLNQQSK